MSWHGVTDEEKHLEAEATRILREAGITEDGRTKSQAANPSQRAFERRRVHSCPFGGYSRRKR